MDFFKKTVGYFQFRKSPPQCFVLGNQKSGTSAVAGLMAAATGKRTLIDFDIDRVSLIREVRSGARSLQSFFFRNGERLQGQEIIKEPHLTFALNHLLEVFPETSVVFVVRDPVENIRSIAERLRLDREGLNQNVGRFLSERREHLSQGWQLVFDDVALNGKDSFEQTVLELLVQRWMLAVRAIRDCRSNVVTIRYEQFQNDKEAEIARVCREADMVPIHPLNEKAEHSFQPPGPKRFRFDEKDVLAIRSDCRDEMEWIGYEADLIESLESVAKCSS